MSNSTNYNKPYIFTITNILGEFFLNSNLPEHVKNMSNISKLDDEIIINIDVKEYIKVLITSEINIETKLRINIVRNCEISELLFAGLFDNVVLNGDCSEVYFGGGCDYFNVEINTNDLPKLILSMAAIHNLKIKNLSQNTTLYLGVSPHLYTLDINQEDLVIFKYQGYDHDKTKLESNTKLHYINLDPEKNYLGF